MIGTLYTITNKSGASFSFNDHATDPVNFIALQAYPQFGINIKNNEIAKEGQHGIWDFYSFYGRRSINFQGIIVGEDEQSIEDQKELMLNVLGFPTQPTVEKDGVVFLRWTDLNGIAWEIECKLQANIRFDRAIRDKTLIDFIFNLKAADPFILGQIVHSIAGTRGWQTTGGEFPLAMPALLGITFNNVMTISNDSSIDANTVIRIYGEVEGPVTNPRIYNQSTGKTLYLSSTIADETGWIEVDSKLGTVVDQDGNDLSGDIIGDSEFIVLVPGLNDIFYESDEDPLITLYEPSAPFTVKYRDTKI